jgi:hypothetical protein
VEEAVRWYAAHPAPTDGGGVWGVQDGTTALLLAAQNGHTATVDALLAAGAEVNTQRKVCTSPHPAPTSLIVSATGAGVLRRGESPRRRPPGVTQSPSLLADDVVWVGWGVQDGWTPLHMAAVRGHTAIVDALLAAGVDVNIKCLPRMWVCGNRARHDGGGGRQAVRGSPGTR